MSQPIFIDFEASSLGANSYPIEVAWSDDNGAVESWLIDPTTVTVWTDWSQDAEQTIHGLSRARLATEGKSPAWVMQRMNQALTGQTVYCDGGPFDRFWLHRLCQVTGCRPRFLLADFDDLLTSSGLTQHALSALEQEAARIAPISHRAAADVKYLAALWMLIDDYQLPATA